MYDLVIRNGLIVDGTGSAPFQGDVAVAGGKIAKIGAVTERGVEEIDAAGGIVTPGFVDVHSHYDGQASWDSTLAPSSLHGVTTVVMGNCGVGFAPAHPDEKSHRELIELMEGVEDIPGTALWEGIPWTWETYPQYLDYLSTREYTMDVASMVPHGAVRAYVMGDRGIRNEAANEDDIRRMAEIAHEGVTAGAFGFSTNRVLGHQAISGLPVPGTFAQNDELMGIGRAAASAGGVFQLIPGGSTGTAGIELGLEMKEQELRDEIRWMGELSRETGMKVTFLLAEAFETPDTWKDGLRWTEEENKSGAKLRPQVGARALGLLLSWDGRHMFERRTTYVKLAELPFEERIKELRKPEVKAAILADEDVPIGTTSLMDLISESLKKMYHFTYRLGVPLNYEPTPDMAVSAIAERRSVSPQEVVYDLMMEEDGRALLITPSLNYARGNEDAMFTMLSHPDTVLGLADGGAHGTVCCDGSVPTYMLSHWAKGRTRGPRFSIEEAVRIQTSGTAGLMGLNDRGVLAVGKRADINVIDLDRLELGLPRMTQDLPAGGKRLIQGATGYIATIVAGTIVRRNDKDTGARPGRLVRRNEIAAAAMAA